MRTVKIGKRELPFDFFLFLIISILLGIVSAVESTSLANRLYEDLNFTVMQRSLLETPREAPGVLALFLIGILNGLGDLRIAALANIVGGVGLLFFGVTDSGFSLVLLFLVIYSVGQHLYLPLSNSLAMSFAQGENFGRRIGEVQSLGAAAVIVAAAMLFIIYHFFQVTYQAVFIFAAFCMILGGVLFFFMGSGQKKVVSEKRFVFKKEYKKYYVLSIINGARKQLTLTFVPWLIIDIYNQPVTTMTLLFFIVCVINIFFKPWFGRFTDKKGERRALQLEAVIMFIACLGFAFADKIFTSFVALGVVGFCYVIDKLMESASIPRATYVRRLTDDTAEVGRTLTMGLAMDHVVSMFIPLVAGSIWYMSGANGYMYVFMGGLAISAVNFSIASRL
ncbi:MAG: MFS transporter [Clostridiales bacterium]|nr:MFS transporter [Clostridiales bacterium]